MTRKQYTTPTLTTHGDVQILTQNFCCHDGSGLIWIF